MNHLKQAANIILNGGVVAFPTETVYGLGANAFNESAVAQIFKIKQRPFFDPLIVHVSDYSMLDRICVFQPDAIEKIMSAFWPGPLTLVLNKKDSIPELVTSGLQTVAVRMPSHPMALELIKLCDTPLAAPSANPFGYLSPTEASHVLTQLGDKVPLVLDGGRCTTGIESTIVDLTTNAPRILRLGGIEKSKIEDVLGSVEVCTSSSQPKAPGQLDSHYAPRKAIQLLDDKKIPADAKESALLSFTKFESSDQFKIVEILSEDGDLVEATMHFFSALHRLDKANVKKIYATLFPEEGLGLAIMDRLKRACHL